MRFQIGKGKSCGIRRRSNSSLTAFCAAGSVRTSLRKDLIQVEKVRSKKETAGRTFQKYSGSLSPETLAPEKFIVVQAALLRALERDLGGVLAGLSSAGTGQLNSWENRPDRNAEGPRS
jgi:hypothetical protein